MHNFYTRHRFIQVNKPQWISHTIALNMNTFSTTTEWITTKQRRATYKLLGYNKIIACMYIVQVFELVIFVKQRFQSNT